MEDDCLLEGSLILTPCGYVPIENLVVGDKVITFPNQDIALVDRIFRTDAFACENLTPFRIPKHIFGNGVPSKDMYLSAHHSYFDPAINTWIFPIQSPHRFRQVIDRHRFTYYNLKLDNEHVHLICQDLPVKAWDGKSSTYM